MVSAVCCVMMVAALLSTTVTYRQRLYIFHHTCHLVHIHTVVENISKRREPFPVMAGVYFLSPTQNSIARLIDDFSLSSQPQYKEAHVFFSSPVHPSLLSHIKACSSLVKHLKSLKEVRWLLSWDAL